MYPWISDIANRRISTLVKLLQSYPFTDFKEHESVINIIITIAFVHTFPETEYDVASTASKIADKLQSQVAIPDIDGEGNFTAQWVEERYCQLKASENGDYRNGVARHLMIKSCQSSESAWTFMAVLVPSGAVYKVDLGNLWRMIEMKSKQLGIPTW